jgi:hypothetical protein
VCDIERVRKDLLSIAHSEEFKNIVRDLTLDEYYLLRAICKPKILKKNNLRVETIKKNLPPKHKDLRIDRVLQSLRNKRLIQTYRREDNWQISTLGKKFADVIIQYEAIKRIQ